jgi:pimeloyl-ACP methyl ester carboxylesterase
MAVDALKEISGRFGHIFEDVCRLIIRPERAEYVLDDLGPALFRLGENETARFERIDLDLENMRGLRLRCSWFLPERADPSTLPCLVYLHGNCGCRLDALEALPLLRHGVSIFGYDASGSGHSDGEYVTLGFYERQDLACVVEHLHSRGIADIGLWGRSMGAVTAIMYAAKDPSIRCLIGDSPFSSLKRLAGDLVTRHAGAWVPKAVVSTAVKKIRKKIAKMAQFDINDLDAAKYARLCNVPSFLFHGEADDFVLPYHSVAVADSFNGSCIHRIVKGSHNGTRGDDVMSIAVPFVTLYLIDKPAARRAAAVATSTSTPSSLAAIHEPSSPNLPAVHVRSPHASVREDEDAPDDDGDDDDDDDSSDSGESPNPFR